MKEENYIGCSQNTCVKTLVIVQGVPLVELFLAELTCVLFHPIVHIHVVLNKISAWIFSLKAVFIPENWPSN